MKKYIFFVLSVSTLSAQEIDVDKFIKNSDEIISTVEDCEKLLCDSSDVYTYYWLQGKIAGLKQAQKILEDCKIK